MKKEWRPYIRWSIQLTVFVALCLECWYSCTGSMPAVGVIFGVVLPFKISHWWDILIGLLIVPTGSGLACFVMRIELSASSFFSSYTAPLLFLGSIGLILVMWLLFGLAGFVLAAMLSFFVCSVFQSYYRYNRK